MHPTINKLVKRYPKRKCPSCGKRSGARIIRGYPTDEMFELERMGHVTLLGCEPPLANEPDYRYQCTICDHK